MLPSGDKRKRAGIRTPSDRKNEYCVGGDSDNTPYEKIGTDVRSIADEIPFDILSDYFTQEVLKDDTRVKMPKTNKESLSKILVPVPPKGEQLRISDRVKMLMHLITTM